MHSRVSHRAFALAEGAAVFVVAAFVVALLLVIGSEQRRSGRLGEDISKLRTLGNLTGSYAADNGDRFWTYSWKKGQSLSQWPDLNNAPTDMRAAANQFADILRRRTGRLEITGLDAFIPHLTYSNVVLEDYGELAPDLLFVSAMDTLRLNAARDPKAYDNGGTWQRFPYNPTFMVPTCFLDKAAAPNRVYQPSNTHGAFAIPLPYNLDGNKITDVGFPTAKVLLHDTNARHFGTKMPYCTHDEARLPLLFVDSSVRVHAAQEANPGWQPNSPAAGPTQFVYGPALWEPQTFSGAPSEPVIGRFRWTRGTTTQNGLAGRDFGGPETCSGQPGCP